jgi:hypothetical protein
MALIVDMEYAAFKRFNNREFYWQELSDMFVLTRTAEGTIQRCVVLKSGGEQDILKARSLLSDGIKCFKLTFGDEPEAAKKTGASKALFQ